MAVDKSLYQAPQGVDLGAPGLEVEIEIVDDDAVPGEEGPEEAYEDAADDTFNENLAETLDPSVLQSLVADLDKAIEDDKNSRANWEKSYKEGLILMGLQYEERTEPWDGACGVFHPMITEAVVRFQSETITETFPAGGPVRTKIIGKETPKKKQAAKRVEEDMNYQVTERMVEFRSEHELMLWTLAAAGSAFKKVYFDPSLDRQISVFIPPEDIILPYGTTDLFSCDRVTHEMRKTKEAIERLQEAGFYSKVDLPDPTKEKDDIKQAKDKETGFSDINDSRYLLRECHVALVIDGAEEGDAGVQLALPYVVTYIKGTNTVLSVRRNWLVGDPLKIKRQHFIHYKYIPGFGAYGFGLFHLVGGFAKSATSLLRQLIDAGTLSNLPGGLKARSLRIKGDDTPIAPGEFRDVDVGSGTIRDNILPLPYKEPSGVLAGMLDKIVDEGRRFASSADMQVSDMSAQSPVGSTLAVLERQLKVMTAIQARVHHALKQELCLIADIVEDHTSDDYDYEPDEGPVSAKKSDYKHTDIIPVSDPNAATLAQRVVQFQAVWQMAQAAPDVYDMPQLHRTGLEIMGIKNAAKLVPLPEDMTPKDPVTENMMALKLEPMKAFLFQDHESHIKVHMSAAQDPIIMQLIGQNPKAGQIQAAMMAHVAEHAGFAYRQRIEQQLGMAIPYADEDSDDDEASDMSKLPHEVQNAMAQMMAQAAQQVLEMNKQQVAQQQAQQQAQDPVLQLQKQELQIKQQDVQIKGQKVQAETQLKQQQAMQQAQIETQRLQLEAKDKDEKNKIAQGKMLADAAAKADATDVERQRLQMDAHRDQASRDAQQESEGARMGVDIADKHAARAFEARKLSLELTRPQPPAGPRKGPRK